MLDLEYLLTLKSYRIENMYTGSITNNLKHFRQVSFIPYFVIKYKLKYELFLSCRIVLNPSLSLPLSFPFSDPAGEPDDFIPFVVRSVSGWVGVKGVATTAAAAVAVGSGHIGLGILFWNICNGLF